MNNGTPAAAAGIKAGDVILEFNGRSVEDDSHLINMVSQANVGETVRLKSGANAKPPRSTSN